MFPIIELPRRPDYGRPNYGKSALFALCLVPLAWLVWQGLAGGLDGALGANPIKAVNRFLGDWALRFLLIALAVTPLRIVTGAAQVMQYRRMLGLFAFFYATLHVSSYVGLDQFFAWGDIWKDITKRNFITIGMISFTSLIFLAATSPKSMVKRLGAARWKKLHKLVYPVAILVVLHYIMMVKADLRLPMIHGGILAVLLGVRIFDALRREAAVNRAAGNGAAGNRATS